MTEKARNAAETVLKLQKNLVDRNLKDAERKAYYQGLQDMFDLILNNEEGVAKSK